MVTKGNESSERPPQGFLRTINRSDGLIRPVLIGMGVGSGEEEALTYTHSLSLSSWNDRGRSFMNLLYCVKNMFQNITM